MPKAAGRLGRGQWPHHPGSPLLPRYPGQSVPAQRPLLGVRLRGRRGGNGSRDWTQAPEGPFSGTFRQLRREGAPPGPRPG